MSHGLPQRRRRWLATLRMRRLTSLTVLTLIVVLGVNVASLVSVLRAPGNDPVSARLAEWGRDHDLGFLVTQLEALQYRLNPPKTGGVPNTKLLALATSRTVTARDALQRSVATIDSPALPGEGRYKVLRWVKGDPVLQVAYLRPDSVHTSYLSAVVWMSARRTRLILHPGVTDPGHLSWWTQKPYLTRAASSGVVAAFNSGFKLSDSKGGLWMNRRTSNPLMDGAASLVVYRDGHADIGVWGRDVSLSSEVVSVRQNLKLLVDHGRITSDIETAVKSNWGATIGGTFNVWRSGIGITADGNLVYVIGDTLSAKSLAQILLNAGAVRAMQLDINKAWPSYYWYTANARGELVSHKVLDFQRPADRYFTTNNRDFYSVLTR